MEGTLSLFDWRPAPPAQEQPRLSLVSVPAAPAQRIIVFDSETTGIDFAKDQIIELCVQFGLDDGGLPPGGSGAERRRGSIDDGGLPPGGSGAERRTWRIKPAVPINPAAQAVHGISAEELDGCPAFAEYADEIAQVFAEADVIVGYNLSFDIDMLQAEYARLGRPLLDLSGKRIVDPFRLWQQCEPRSLQHAHRRFVGDEFAAAHSATADVAATGRVLAGMLRAFKLDDRDWSQIATVCDPKQELWGTSWVGPSRHLRWSDGVVVLGFGKYAGAAVHELAAGPDRSFLRWVIERDFPAHVAEICRAALERTGDEFLTWTRSRFGQPAPTAQPPFLK